MNCVTCVVRLQGPAQYYIERERSSIFFRGYRYTLRDQDTTWLAACGTVHRGYEGRDLITRGFKYGLYKVRSPA